MKSWNKLVPAMLAIVSITAGLSTAQQQKYPDSGASKVTAEDLLVAPVGADWTSYNGDYTGRRFSSLREINVSNVAKLSASWVFHPGNSQRIESTPVVVRGIMYATSANDVFALDARTGRALWHHQRPVSTGLLDDAAAHINRGVAVWQDFVYVETDDAHLLCLDARSGGVRWEVTYADKAKHYGSTSAPLVVKDNVIVGSSGGDSGVRGFLAAYDALTGTLKWKLWTIPAPGEFGSSSWPGDAYLHGGGTTWMPGTYDPVLDTLYWTTSNPAPDFAGESRPGEDLYTNCVLAIDPGTGKLKWHFQFTPHDLYDSDSNETPVLLDIPAQGSSSGKDNLEPRRLLVQANRNGFLYVLDRTNGKFLNAVPFVKKLNWATGVDPSGRPVLSGLIPTEQGAYICPGINGATNWFSPSYNPDTKLFFFMALENCNLFFKKPRPFALGQTYYGSGTQQPPDEHAEKVLLAFSLPDAKLAWRYKQVGQGNSWAGTMATAGGLVFFGDDAGSLEAVEGSTGRALWHFNTGQTMHASPMSYAIGGVQYVAIAAGSDIFSFSLPR